MKKDHKITVLMIVSVVLFFFFLFWFIGPLTGPIAGVGRSSDELIEWIQSHNTIVLVNPVPIMEDRNGSYYNWAYEIRFFHELCMVSPELRSPELRNYGITNKLSKQE